MKVAIFHNYLDNIGGAEVMTLTLAEALGADIYSCAANHEHIKKMGFAVTVKVIGSLPKEAPLRQQKAAQLFRKLNLKDQYDFYIVSGDWAVSGLVNHHPNLWYAHGPKRELWDMFTYTRDEIVPDGTYIKNLHRWVFTLWTQYNRFLDLRYIAKADTIVCNSKTVRQRIKHYLQRDATVIYPPTNTAAFYNARATDYWLSVNRTSPAKRIELQLEAWRHMSDKKLIMVATYEDTTTFREYRTWIEDNKPDNVTLLNHVSKDELTRLYAECRGFITTAREEDFGLTAIEAMAAGKAVVAPNEGGYRESVVDTETGILIDDITPEKIIVAVETIDQNPEKYIDASTKRAEIFSAQKFVAAMKAHIGYEQ